MPIYGIAFYGGVHFGVDPALVRPDFSVEPFASTALDHSTLLISWTRPPSTDCTQLQLVRNNFNLPQDETDGYLMFPAGWDYSAGASPPVLPALGDLAQYQSVSSSPTYIDTWPSPGINYYSMFGWDSVNSLWIRCSDLIGILPVDWGFGDRLYELLPGAYHDRDIVLVDFYNPWPDSNNPQPPLQRYLSLIGFELDFIRTEVESLLSINDDQRLSGALLPLMGYQLGLRNEPELGMQQFRQLTGNAVHLYKLKGSARGISEFASILTSYPTMLVHQGYNKLLSLDDSVMMSTIGTWQSWPPVDTHFPSVGGENTGLTLTRVPNLLTVPTMTNPTEIIGFEPGVETNFPYGGVDGNSPTGMSIRVTGASTADIVTGAIPVLDFLSSTDGPGSVTWTVQIFSPTAARNVELSVWGDDGTGVPIPVVAPVVTASTLRDWRQMTVSAAVSPFDPNYPNNPPAYNWLYPRVRVQGMAANEVHYLTLCMLWACDPEDVGGNVPFYDYPRDLKLVLQPQSANLLTNPLTNFSRWDTTTSDWIGIGFDGWSAVSDPTNLSSPETCALSIRYVEAGDPAGAFAVYGTGSLQVDPSGPGNVLWGGTIQDYSTPPPIPAGWYVDPNDDWFGGAKLGPGPSRWWFDSAYGWYFENNQYFSIGAAMIGGDWFPQQQPTINNDIVGLLPFPAQPFNLSVYARYMAVADPSDAVMDMGVRWYFPDGTHTESSERVTLTNSFTEGNAPDHTGRYRYVAVAPFEAVSLTPATSFYIFFRFPYAQEADIFLLNAAMLSPGPSLSPFIDSSLAPGNEDYFVDSHGATYYYRRRAPRRARLDADLYRWIPMGATYTLIYGAGNLQPPLDPTLW